MGKSKLYSMLLSVVIAFGLWLYVVNNVSQETEATFYNIPVAFEREAALDERNLLIAGQSTQTVSLKLSGARSDLNKVSSANITVTADLSVIDTPGDRIPLTYNITFPGDVASNAIVVESRSPSYIYLDVDSRRTKEVPVVVQWTGTRSGDHVYDTENAVLDNPTVTVTGPAEVADQIDHAMIQVDLTDRVESVSESYRYTLCNADGEPVDAAKITTNVEEVRVDMQIRRIKTVKLVADVIYGGGTSVETATVTVEPGVIRLTGSDARLTDIGDTYTVCTINLAEIEKSQDLKYAISIPEGVNNITGVTEAVVSVKFTGLSIREFVIDRDNFQLINVPEGLEAEIVESSMTVKVRGPASEIALLTDEDITAVVDLSSAEAGMATYKMVLTFQENYPNVGALKTSSVTVSLGEPEDE